jgi:hypothetical protein
MSVSVSKSKPKNKFSPLQGTNFQFLREEISHGQPKKKSAGRD